MRLNSSRHSIWVRGTGSRLGGRDDSVGVYNAGKSTLLLRAGMTALGLLTLMDLALGSLAGMTTLDVVTGQAVNL